MDPEQSQLPTGFSPWACNCPITRMFLVIFCADILTEDDIFLRWGLVDIPRLSVEDMCTENDVSFSF